MFWIVNAVSFTVAAGNVVAVIMAVPMLFKTTNELAAPIANVGSLSNPWVIRSSSARILADVAAEPVDGNAPCV